MASLRFEPNRFIGANYISGPNCFEGPNPRIETYRRIYSNHPISLFGSNLQQQWFHSTRWYNKLITKFDILMSFNPILLYLIQYSHFSLGPISSYAHTIQSSYAGSMAHLCHWIVWSHCWGKLKKSEFFGMFCHQCECQDLPLIFLVLLLHPWIDQKTFTKVIVHKTSWNIVTSRKWPTFDQ